VLAWLIGGGILAIALSSAGPCYYADLGLSPNPYQPLMYYLHNTNEQFPIWALIAQRTLWEAYIGADTLVSGISAMPSMHVTIVVIQAIMGWRLSKWLGTALSLYAITILVGSVHLGWHYAVDGYVAIALAFLCWWLSGMLVASTTPADQATLGQIGHTSV
jgi:hypothetical protein